MDFSFSNIMGGFVFGVFGIYCIREGKKRSNLGMILIGVGLLVFPYFMANPWALWTMGIGLLYWAYRIY